VRLMTNCKANPGVPTHSNESSSSTMEPKTVGTLPSFSVTAPTPEGPNVVRSSSEGTIVLHRPTPTRSASEGSRAGKRKAEYVESSKDSKITVTGLDPHRMLFYFNLRFTQNLITSALHRRVSLFHHPHSLRHSRTLLFSPPKARQDHGPF
jgi:hypothetical protein